MNTIPFYRRVVRKIAYLLAPYLSDELFLKLYFWANIGKRLNLKNPKTFNEKLQWLKMESKNHPEYTKMVDKIDAKDYVASIIGEEYIIPTIATYNSVDEVDFDKLPNQFVLKCTHDSGGIVVCKEKSKLDKKAALKKLSSCIDANFDYVTREYPYKNVQPRIIAEQYLEDDSGWLQDYKIHNFNGVPKFTLVCGNRFTETGLTEDFYSLDWNLMELRRPNHPNADKKTPKPKEIEELYKLATKLSKDMPFVRTDFYIVNHKIYFGEITFFPSSGMGCFEPKEWDFKLGEMIKLPIDKQTIKMT